MTWFTRHYAQEGSTLCLRFSAATAACAGGLPLLKFSTHDTLLQCKRPGGASSADRKLTEAVRTQLSGLAHANLAESLCPFLIDVLLYRLQA